VNVKTTLVAIALGFSLSVSVPIYATGIPTFDAATFLQLQQQLSQLQDQYRTFKDQYAAVTGSYGRGSIGLNQSINAASVVPGSWQEVVSQQQSGTFGARQSYYEKLINTMPQDVFANPNAQNATSYKMSTDSVRAALAGGDSLYSEVQTHLNNLSVMSQQVDTTTNVKDAQDLQNRISSENGMLSSAMAKLNAMNMNLQANLVNQQNQATAGNQKFYQWKK
jgi:type IV secretion system protein VirB5